MLAGIVNPAGGIYYHLSALSYQKKLWNPFRIELGQFLKLWEPPQKDLLIFGASGGYCLQPEFLDRFNNIQIIDVDPLAKFIFKNRFKKKIQWDHSNYLKEGVSGLLKLKPLLKNRAILFSNILGQLPLITSTKNDFECQFKISLEKLLSNECWASFHDQYSFPWKNSSIKIESSLGLAIKNKNSEFKAMEELLKYSNKSIQIIDHRTKDLFPEHQNQQLFLWSRLPKYIHIVEGLYHN